MIFYVVELLDDWKVDIPSWKYPRELGIAQSVISRLWQRFQDDGNVSRCYSTGHPRVATPNEDRYIFGSYCQKKQTEHSIRPVSSALFSYRYDSFKADRVQTLRAHWSICSTDLHVQSVTMTGHIYRDVILEQHLRLLRGAMGAEFLFMDDNARPHRANIVDECLQSEDITHMDWPAYSPDLNPIEHVWDMLGRRIAAHQPPPTCLPELWRALLDEWCNIPQDEIDNLILSMPRRFHYFVRGGFVRHRSRASSKHLSPHLPVGELDSSGGQTGVALHLQMHVWVSVYKETDQMLLFSRSDVTALALSYGTFPLRKV
ncbi:transposable element Tcb1 transposase [Trichonephila clavipes]|nr:transposable element Tcb1 transposase [Trichonephila clavipes]